MPNWCNNSVTITHTDPAKIIELAAAMNAGRFLDHVIPVPEILKNPITTTSYGDVNKQAAADAVRAAAQEATGFESWYDFCVARWGTKWDVDTADSGTVEISADNSTVSVSFESAWSPPCGVYEELVEQGYDVVGYYYEGSMGFVGKWHNGDDLCYDYSGLNSETVRGYIGDELDDYWCISESMAEYEAENEPTEELTEWIRDGADKRGLVTT